MNYRAWNHRCWLVSYVPKTKVIDELVNHRDWDGLHVADNSCFHYRTVVNEYLLIELFMMIGFVGMEIVSRQIMLLDFINGLPKEKRKVNGLKIFNTECLDLVAPPDLICRDKFLVQNTAVPEGTKEEDVTSTSF
nr:protein prenyltransferase alpha subunit repeat-containing protein 1 isoform X2 [Tanacetum cinerariifolium]